MKKLSLLVSGNEIGDNAQFWYELAVFLSREMKLQINLETTTSMQDFRARLCTSDIAYIPPQDAYFQVLHRKFQPLCRLNNYYDELTLIANNQVKLPGLEGVQGAVVGSIDSSFSHWLGKKLFHKKGITPTSVIEKESWQELLDSLLSNQINFALMSKSYLQRIRKSEFRDLHIISSTNIKRAFPFLAMNTFNSELHSEFKECLLTMHLHNEGKKILQRNLQPHWDEVGKQEFDRMVSTMNQLTETNKH